MIWVNFKVYKNTFGNGAVLLAKVCRQVEKETGVIIIPVVSALDLRTIKQEVGGSVWLQSLDLGFEGKYTGSISPLAAIAAGADGALINHSEKELAPGKISQLLSYLKKESWIDRHCQNSENIVELRKRIEQFQAMICFKTKGQLSWLTKLRPKPDFVAYESPTLIGGKFSVASVEPKTISHLKENLSDYQFVIGAGINSSADVEKALDLGAVGVLVSSDVVIATDPKKELLDLASGFKNNV